MKTYRAHYASPAGADPVNGTFEFESDARAGSRRNGTDARVKMLELFGKAAVSWTIDGIELAEEQAPGDGAAGYIQPALDFREPQKVRRHHTFDRGKV